MENNGKYILIGGIIAAVVLSEINRKERKKRERLEKEYLERTNDILNKMVDDAVKDTSSFCDYQPKHAKA